jgi:hypothetical protein
MHGFIKTPSGIGLIPKFQWDASKKLHGVGPSQELPEWSSHTTPRKD